MNARQTNYCHFPRESNVAPDAHLPQLESAGFQRITLALALVLCLASTAWTQEPQNSGYEFPPLPAIPLVATQPLILPVAPAEGATEADAAAVSIKSELEALKKRLNELEAAQKTIKG